MEARSGGSKIVPVFSLFGQSTFMNHCLIPVMVTSKETPPGVVHVQIKLHDRFTEEHRWQASTTWLVIERQSLRQVWKDWVDPKDKEGKVLNRTMGCAKAQTPERMCIYGTTNIWERLKHRKGEENLGAHCRLCTPCTCLDLFT